MLVDSHGRHITDLRVSVTDRCNYRCVYCMPAGGVALGPRSGILEYEKIAAVTDAAGQMGFCKIKLTGGEPLVRKGLERLVAMIAAQGWYGDIGMTTNGSLLSPQTARSLKAAGLQRVNISLDTLDPGEFSRITRGGSIADVLAGIDAARSAGLRPIKINMVVFATTAADAVESMRQFCRREGLRLQTIARFSLSGRPAPVPQMHTARPHRCSGCCRLRLTCDGYLKSCLRSDGECAIDFGDIAGSILRAVESKPLSGTACSFRTMNRIGG